MIYLFIGIDLGGTNIAAGLVDESGKILASDSVPTGAERGSDAIISDMADLAKRIAEKNGYKISDIDAIGIGAPGTIDTDRGVVAYSNNIPFRNVPIAEKISGLLNIPVHIENDANAAAYGEYIATGAKAKSFVFITLGTGVGGGVVIDGKLMRGFNYAGAELGHCLLVLNGEACTCGNNGCWEAYASVTALIRQTKKAMDENPNSIMHEIAEKEGKVSGKTAFVAASRGDEAAKGVVDKYTEYVGAGIASIINVFQPEELVIGGGISKEGDNLLIPVQKIVSRMDYNKYMPKTKISIAKLYNDAGIIGAALIARK